MRRMLLILLLLAPTLQAGQVKVAAAANFTAAMKELATLFRQTTGHQALVSFGSTGKLYAQIVNGAPFQVFLAADRKRPQMLHLDGQGEAPFTYATGRLALWSPDSDLIDDRGEILSTEHIARLAIANPKTAPYGTGALQVLQAKGVLPELRRKLVRGDNIAQTYQFVATGNVPMGFVAISQVIDRDRGSLWIPPQALYDRLDQDAILLSRGVDDPAAQAFVRFLGSDEARAVIQRYGYAG